MTEQALPRTKGREKPRINKPLLQKKAKGVLASVLRFALIVCLSYLILAPILQNLTVAFTHPEDLGMATSIWVPQRFSIQNWHVSLLMLDYWKALPFTFLHTSIMVLLQTICTMLAGYSFARFKFRFRSVLFACVVFTIIVPPQVFMMPQYLFFRNFDIFGIITALTGKPLNLLNSTASLYVMSAVGMGIKSGLYIYIFRQTFRGLPKELEEAAYIDGAGFLRTFVSIVLPAASAGILTVVVLSFVWNWNDSYYTNLFDNNNVRHLMLAYVKATASVDEALAKVASRVPAEYSFLMKNPVYEGAIAKTASMLVFLPLVLLYSIIQRRFVQGVERSGITGM